MILYIWLFTGFCLFTLLLYTSWHKGLDFITKDITNGPSALKLSYKIALFLQVFISLFGIIIYFTNISNIPIFQIVEYSSFPFFICLLTSIYRVWFQHNNYAQ